MLACATIYAAREQNRSTRFMSVALGGESIKYPDSLFIVALLGSKRMALHLPVPTLRRG
jgi:hypothetical protein